MSWFWSSGGSILTQIKKNAGRKINTTPRKIQSPVFSSPVNHRNPRLSAYSCPESALIIYPMHFSKCLAHLPLPSPFLFQYLPL